MAPPMPPPPIPVEHPPIRRATRPQPPSTSCKPTSSRTAPDKKAARPTRSEKPTRSGHNIRSEQPAITSAETTSMKMDKGNKVPASPMLTGAGEEYFSTSEFSTPTSCSPPSTPPDQFLPREAPLPQRPPQSRPKRKLQRPSPTKSEQEPIIPVAKKIAPSPAQSLASTNRCPRLVAPTATAHPPPCRVSPPRPPHPPLLSASTSMPSLPVTESPATTHTPASYAAALVAVANDPFVVAQAARAAQAQAYAKEKARECALIHKEYQEALKRATTPPTAPVQPRTAQSPHTQPPSQPSTQPPTTPPTQPQLRTVPARVKYPPLIVEHFPDWAQEFRKLKEQLGRAPNARPFGKGVRFQPTTDEEYRLIQRHLTVLEKEKALSWFSYSLPQERSLKVAIRGLPVNTDPAEIEDGLRELGYVPEYVRQINARHGRPGCIFYAQLRCTDNLIPGIYEVTEFLCMSGVKIEAWRGKQGPAQCHRCQQFRHSSHNCHRRLACVRCGGEHPARDCPRPKDQTPTCANCSGPHTANNAACPVIRKERRNRRAGTAAITTTTPAVQKTTHAPQAQQRTQELQQPEPASTGSLMAAANDPSKPNKRRKKRSNRKPPAPPTPGYNSPDEATARTMATAMPAACAPAPTMSTEPAASTANDVPALQTRLTGADKAVVTATVQILQEVLEALLNGTDPHPIISRGLTQLSQQLKANEVKEDQPAIGSSSPADPRRA